MSHDVDLEAIVLDEANDFVTFESDEVPADEVALAMIIAGEQAQSELYKQLVAATDGEKRFLFRLLDRDWSRRFPKLVASGCEMISQITGADQRAVDARPDLDTLARLAAKLKVAAPRQLVDFVLELGDRILICAHLLPWKSETAVVAEHFTACLEAEERHLSFIDSLAELAED